MEHICIVCPNGCRLTVTPTADGLLVTGHTCPRGEKYGREEATNPTRVVTAVVRTDSHAWPCVPVKSSEPVPRKKIARLLGKLYALKVSLPVKRGDTLIDPGQLAGIRVVFTRSLPPPEEMSP